MAAGRPTEYSEEVAKLAKLYLEDYRDNGEAVPTIVGLCRYIDRARSTVYKWASEVDKPEFSDIVEQLLEFQEFDLVNRGLNNELNPQIAKTMMAKHGYSDKQEVDHKSTDGSMSPERLSDKEIDARISQLISKVEK